MRPLLLLLLALCPAFSAVPPNIIFILADDFGYGDLGCMGCTDITTPNIDRLAAEGVKFTDFYANAPVCTPTRAGFITGRWQQRCGLEFAFGYQVEQFRRVNGAWVPEKDIHSLGLPLGEITLAQKLKSAGYSTGAFGNGISASKTSTIRSIVASTSTSGNCSAMPTSTGTPTTTALTRCETDSSP